MLENNIVIRKILKRILIYSIVFCILSIVLITMKKATNEDVLVNYNFIGQMNYSIIAKEGMIIGDGGASQDLFVSSTINDITVNFDYKLALNNYTNIKYKYFIKSYVIAELDDASLDQKELFRKTHELINTNYTIVNTNKVYINDKVSLNYDYYNTIAKEYNNSVNVPVKSKLMLEITMFVEYENGKQEEYKDYLSFPLEKSTFSIDKGDKKYSGSIKKDIKENFIYTFVSIILIMSLIYIFLVMYEIIKFYKYKKEHFLEFKYKKIMRDYDNIVVPINKLPRDKNIVVIKVLFFKSMIDMQKELHLPILCYRAQSMIIYMILSNKLAYIYVLNNEKEKI